MVSEDKELPSALISSGNKSSADILSQHKQALILP